MEPSDSPELHESLRPLGWLIGRWQGAGEGSYPTIEPFAYLEDLEVAHDGRPLMRYLQRTFSPDPGRRPMHSESGFWRVVGPGRIEMVLAHTFGLVEVQEGSFSEDRIEVRSQTLVSTSTAKRITSLSRVYERDGDHLGYVVSMAAAGQSEVTHLRARLKRVSAR